MQTTTTTRPDVTYTATIGADESGVSLIVTRDVRAGICGPHGEAVVADLPAAEQWLTEQGYELARPWQFVQAYDGLRLSATLAGRS